MNTPNESFQTRVRATALVICLILAGLCTASASESTRPDQIWQVPPDLEIRVLQPGVWLHTSWWTLDNGLRYPSNGLIVREEDSVLLIDTAWGEASTEALLEWIEEVLALPVSATVSTHAHDDRMGGAPVLAERGIPLFAHPRGFEMAAGRGWPEPQSIGNLGPGDAVRFHDVEVFYPGAGHTTDNIMVWLPDSHLLVGGCAVKSADSKTLGNTADADLAEWPASMRRVIEQYPDVELVIPGHGVEGGGELLLHTLDLLESNP